MGDVSKDLKKMSKVWTKTEAKQGGGGNRLPDGEYKLKLVSMEVTKSKKGRLQVATKFKVRKPKDLKGKETMTFHGLENENNVAYFKGFCEVFGIELPDDMEELPEALEAFVNECEDDLTVKFKTNTGGYQNMTILAVGENEVETATSEDSDDDSDSDSDSDDDDDDDDDDKKKKKKKKKDDDDDDDDSDSSDDDDDDDDKKKKKKKKKEEDEDGDGDDDDDDDDEPKKKKKKKKK